MNIPTAILWVQYRSSAEQDGPVMIYSEEALSSRMAELQALDTVKSITQFNPATTSARKIVWERIEGDPLRKMISEQEPDKPSLRSIPKPIANEASQ